MVSAGAVDRRRPEDVADVIVAGAPLRHRLPPTLARVAEEDGFLFLRYQRRP